MPNNQERRESENPNGDENPKEDENKKNDEWHCKQIRILSSSFISWLIISFKLLF
jgi:hypothetical protein